MRESVYVDNFRLVWAGKASQSKEVTSLWEEVTSYRKASQSKLCPCDLNEKVKIWIKSTADLTVSPHLKLKSSSKSYKMQRMANAAEADSK